MADIGSYILAGSQGLASGLDKLGVQFQDARERQAFLDLWAKANQSQNPIPNAQPAVPNTLASLGQPAPQPIAQQNPGNATTAQLPPISPSNRPVAQGFANEMGQKWAQQPGQIGGNVPALAGLSAPSYSQQSAPTPQRQAAPSQAMAYAGSGVDASGRAISGIESGGRYDALGPLTKGDRAYGKYQVMGSNIGPWTQAYLGRAMSPQEFLANPQAQEAVFQGEFGRLSQKYGPEGAARAWFAGEGGMNDPNRRDVLGTSVADYSSKFVAGGGAGQGQTNPLANVAQMSNSTPQQPQTLAQLSAPPQQQFDMGTLGALMTNKYGAPLAQAILAKQLGRDPIEQQMNLIKLQQAQMGLQNFPVQQQMLNEQLRAARLGNQKTAAELFGESQKLTYQDLGDSIAALNQRGEIVRTIPKSQTATLGEGQQLVNKNTGQVIAGADQKPKLTESQSKDLSLYQRGAEAENLLRQHEGILASGWENAKAAIPGAGNYLASESYQKARQAGREVLAAILRKDTGAAVTKQEEEIYGKMYLPQPGDTPQVIEQKRQARQRTLEANKLGLGRAEGLATARIGQQAQPLDIGKSTEIDGVKIQRIR